MTLARKAASNMVSFASMGNVSFDGRTVMVWVMFLFDVSEVFVEV